MVYYMTSTNTPSPALPKPRPLSKITVQVLDEETGEFGDFADWMVALNIDGARDVAAALEANGRTVRLVATFEVVR